MRSETSSISKALRLVFELKFIKKNYSNKPDRHRRPDNREAVLVAAAVAAVLVAAAVAAAVVAAVVVAAAVVVVAAVVVAAVVAAVVAKHEMDIVNLETKDRVEMGPQNDHSDHNLADRVLDQHRQDV